MYQDYADYIAGLAAAAFFAVFLLFLRQYVVSARSVRIYRNVLGSDNSNSLSSTINTVKKALSPKIGQPNPAYSDAETISLWGDAQTQNTAALHVEAKPNFCGIPALDGFRDFEEIRSVSLQRVFRAVRQDNGETRTIRFIDSAQALLTLPYEVFTRLNHQGLPRFESVAETHQGVFLIGLDPEGIPLSDFIGNASPESLTEAQICRWGAELADILDALHRSGAVLEPASVSLSDIVIMPEGGTLVLRDFGVADLSASSAHRESDKGRDIQCIGSLLTDLLHQRERRVQARTTKELRDVVQRCLASHNAHRYQSAAELSAALRDVPSRWNDIRAQSRRRQKLARVSCLVAAVIWMTCAAASAYFNRNEGVASLAARTDAVMVSVQCSLPLYDLGIMKTSPLWGIRRMKQGDIHWETENREIARVSDSGALEGVNIGTTVLKGTNRNNTIQMDVEVTGPVEDAQTISLEYVPGAETSRFVFTGNGQNMNGELLFPEGICLSEDGTDLYIADAADRGTGGLKVLAESGEVSTLYLRPSYMDPRIVRVRGMDIFTVTREWEEDNGVYSYAIVKYHALGDAEVLYQAEGEYSVVTDLAVSANGTVWFIHQNLMSNITTLQYIREEGGDAVWVAELPQSAACMAFDESENLYISVPLQGMILKFTNESLEHHNNHADYLYYAGQMDDRQFVDGGNCRFYRPGAIAVRGSYLYVLDYDTIRRVLLTGDNAPLSQTLAGEPVNQTNASVKLGSGEKTIFPASDNAGLVVKEDGTVLISDPKNGAIYQVTVP